MLRTLTVTNFALIERVTIEFSEGLNILTGETGAGKSILIDALSAVLGARSSIDSIRTGAEFFLVEAVFDVAPCSVLRNLLDEQGIVLEEDGTLIIRRRLMRSGKNSVLANGSQIPISILRLIGDKLVDMHGQHENQVLLRPESHLSFLDSFGEDIKLKLEEYRGAYRDWQDINKQITVLESQSRERAQRMDMLNWQTQEIAAASLKPGEEETLEQQIEILANAEKIANAINRTYCLLRQGNKGMGAVIDSLAEGKRELEVVVRYDERIQSQLTSVTDVLYQLEETAGDLRNYLDDIEFNPQRLSLLQERMDILYKLKKKYGATVDEILVYYQKAQTELADIINYDETMEEYGTKRDCLLVRMTHLADELDGVRRQAAKLMSERVTEQLTQLGMPQACLLVKVNPASQFSLQGKNEVMILFSANPGEEAKLLHKVASGGELSRIALALKVVCAQRDDIETMIFDEIDAGIGGQTAHMIAEKIAMVAVGKQVLCITHLPQIACMADLHIHIEKKVEESRTSTMVHVLDEREMLLELTRMISGSDFTQIATKNAGQMMEKARIRKEKWKKEAQA